MRPTMAEAITDPGPSAFSGGGTKPSRPLDASQEPDPPISVDPPGESSDSASAADGLTVPGAVRDEPAVVALVDRAVQQRDATAFGELYDRFVDRIYRYVYFRTGHTADAEDLTEQVFLKAWEALPRYRWQGRPFLAWLYRLAHNVYVDHRRAARPTTSLTDDERPIDVPSDAASAEFARRLDADVLAQAVAQLTPEQQQVIVLRFIDGLDTEEIAAILERREGAIRALQMRALQSLRRVLERQGESGVG